MNILDVNMSLPKNKKNKNEAEDKSEVEWDLN